MEKETKDTKKSYAPCRYCKQEIRLNARRCPCCGTLNPTVRTKEVFITTIIIVALLYLIGLFIK